jgi:hypothetical protein
LKVDTRTASKTEIIHGNYSRTASKTEIM